GRVWPLAEYHRPVEVAAAPEAITPLIKRLRESFEFTGSLASVSRERNYYDYKLGAALFGS
ncbi:MAG: hypothetical protein ACI87Q_001226, partial [Pseudohongiellaceae bacterium]